MTSTDICTTMLYGHRLKWLQHLVFSDRFVSIWNCHTNNLSVITKKGWDEIHKHSDRNLKYQMKIPIHP
jgi:hypothetical protein